ncbi:hypothetical protein MAR_024494, partial [Mya arenaria]
MESKGNNVVVEKRGLVVCKDYQGIGASVDGIVNDLTTGTSGCLEVKCPMSRKEMTIAEACDKTPFCLVKDSSGQMLLNRAHDYYIQIQGQMYVLGLSWADFVNSVKLLPVNRSLCIRERFGRFCFRSYMMDRVRVCDCPRTKKELGNQFMTSTVSRVSAGFGQLKALVLWSSIGSVELKG